MEYMNGKELEDTLIYQDFATDVLYESGMPICAYSSLRYNLEKGESKMGVEIKNDKRFKDTGNLYFETHERKSEFKDWTPSGIYRKDNTVFIFIGDFEKAWLFSKEQIKELCRKKDKYGFKSVETKTSKGILIPIIFFDIHKSIVLKEFNFGERKMFQDNINHIPDIGGNINV